MTITTRAIVIGGSMAGMMTARVLSDHFDDVIIIERDQLSEEAIARKGVPQGRHLHLLLPQGQEIMNGYFPELTHRLTEIGSPAIRWGYDNLNILPSGHGKRFDSGIRSNFVSRVMLETLVREQLSHIANIRVYAGTQVTQLLENSQRIYAVETLNRRTKQVETISADLIVDASGRSSKSPEWLQALGYHAPEETVVNAFIGYATRWFEVPQTYQSDYKAILITPNPKAGNYRGGAVFFVEDNKAVVTLQGSNKDYPPMDEDEWLAYAQTLEEDYLYHFAKDATPISPIYGYQRTENRIRHYERLTHRPENFIVLGDAYCAFNPIYGQGMTTAALEVQALEALLKRYSVKSLEGFAEKFQKKIATVIQGAWLMATSEDLQYPDTEGAEPDLTLRIMQTYSRWMLQTATHDEVLLLAFLRMINLELVGIEALHPSILGRVLWHKFVRPKPPRPLDTQISYPQQLKPVSA